MADSNGGADALERELQRISDYKHVFASGEGKRVLNDILDFCGLLNDGFAEDPYVTAYNAGRRSVGCYLLRMLELDHEELRRMAREETTGE